jgi:hypothetical protein
MGLRVGWILGEHMARTIDIAVPEELTDGLVDEIATVTGVISLRVQRSISLKPPGDVISVDATSQGLHEILRRLDARGLTQEPKVSIRTSEPLSICSPGKMEVIVTDDSEGSWEEMEREIARESNMTINGLIVMALAGIIAALGISSNALHLVIGAMVIAPGFEPITRIALGVVTRSRAFRHGVTDSLKGYLALIAGAALITLLMKARGSSPITGEASYLPPATLANYWQQLTVSSLLVSAAASIAGAVLIAANRAVLTAGVMIALALVPSAALVGMALADGNPGVAARAGLRLLIEVGLVALLSMLVLYWKRLQMGRGRVIGDERKHAGL